MPFKMALKFWLHEIQTVCSPYKTIERILYFGLQWDMKHNCNNLHLIFQIEKLRILMNKCFVFINYYQGCLWGQFLSSNAHLLQFQGMLPKDRLRSRHGHPISTTQHNWNSTVAYVAEPSASHSGHLMFISPSFRNTSDGSTEKPPRSSYLNWESTVAEPQFRHL